MYALEARPLRKRPGDTLALDDLNLAIAPGESHCRLGANGADLMCGHFLPRC